MRGASQLSFECSSKPALQIEPVQVGEEGSHGRMLGELPGNPSSSGTVSGWKLT